MTIIKQQIERKVNGHSFTSRPASSAVRSCRSHTGQGGDSIWHVPYYQVICITIHGPELSFEDLILTNVVNPILDIIKPYSVSPEMDSGQTLSIRQRGIP
jgi:hypothetical protein